MKGAKPPRDEPWEAMTRGDFELALDLIDRKSKRDPDRDLLKVRAWLHLGRFEEARSAATNRIVGRVTASQIASASLASVLPRFT